jgi:hypothetical protein
MALLDLEGVMANDERIEVRRHAANLPPQSLKYIPIGISAEMPDDLPIIVTEECA